MPSTPQPGPVVAPIGITVLSDPTRENGVVADVCFVHGLAGHPFKTWLKPSGGTVTSNPESQQQQRSSPSGLKKLFGRSKALPTPQAEATGTGKDRTYWPLDLVVRDFERVRVLTYGYDSHPSHFYIGRTTKMTISQHAQQLLQAVTNVRGECRGRPIIFVAHSLGGILVKDAILRSLKYGDKQSLRDLGHSCPAIIFFGTPHLGANAAVYGDMVAGIVSAMGPSVYKEVLRGLKPDGEVLANINTDFNDLLNKSIPPEQKIQIFSFQEGKGITSVSKFDGKVVPDFSSAFNRRDIEQTFFVNGTHMDMVKLSSEHDQTYDTFKTALREYLAVAQKNAQQHELPRLAQQDEVQSQDNSGVTQALIESLDYGTRLSRQHQISSLDTFVKSFDWLWTEDSLFKSWLQRKDLLFWITGKPASGKSTLMNHISKADQAKTILENVHGGKWSIVHHFFDFRAHTGIENNLEGLIRSLLVQLIAAEPVLIPAPIEVILSSQMSKAQMMTGPISLAFPVCRKAILAILNANSGILLLLDGLDEFGGSTVELLKFINDACDASKSKSIKICLASRPETKDGSNFMEGSGMLMQNVNQKAIEQYACHCFSVISGSETRKDKYEKLAWKVSEHSNGVFLWAYHAVRSVTIGLTEGEDLDASLDARLDEIPKDLDEVYTRIFMRIAADPKKRQFCTIALLLIIGSEADLTLASLFTAMAHLPDTNELCGNFSTSIKRLRKVQYRSRLLAACPGLIDMYDDLLHLTPEQGYIADSDSDVREPGFTTSFIRLTHRTVSEHLESGGWQQLHQVYVPAISHELWLYSSLKAIQENRERLDRLVDYQLEENYRARYLEQKRSEDPWCVGGGTSGLEVDDARTFANSLYYVVEHFLGHAASFEILSRQSSFPIFESFSIVRLAYYHTRLRPSLSDCCSQHEGGGNRDVSETIHLAITHSLNLYIESYLQRAAE